MGLLDPTRSESEAWAYPTKAAGAAREGVVAAAVVGLVSQGMSLGELEALRLLAAAAGMDPAAVGPLIDVADSTLNAS